MIPDTLILKGSITTKAPLATSTPAARPQQSGKNPPSPLPRMACFDDTGVAAEKPYFPGGGLRGKLRRLTLSLLADHNVDPDDPNTMITLDDFYTNAIGGVKDRGQEEVVDLEAVSRLRKTSPLLSLFGCSSPIWLQGRLSVSHLIPVSSNPPVSVFDGVRKDDVRLSTSLADMIRPTDMAVYRERARKISEVSGLKARNGEIDKLLKKAPTEAEKQKLKAEKEENQAIIEAGGVSTLLPLPGYEAFSPGTEFEHSFTLNRACETEIGLFFLCLQAFANYPYIGAHLSHGCGEIAGHWAVTAIHGNNRESYGTVSLDLLEGFKASDDRVWGFIDHTSKGLDQLSVRLKEAS